MKLTELAAKPQLIKITLADADLTAKYGDELEFYVYDRQPLDQFIKMASASQNDYPTLIRLVNDLVLDETGNPVVAEGQALPNDVMMAVIGAVVERLGK
jgi:hypothetical protein